MKNLFEPIISIKPYIFVMVLLISTLHASAQDEFITTWQTFSSNSITIKVKGTPGESFVVDWGDGSNTNYTPSFATYQNITHQYSVTDLHSITITGTFDAVDFRSSAGYLRTIEQWGTTSWNSLANAFEGASLLTYNATDLPNLTNTTSLAAMFKGASAFNGNVSGWNVSNVSDFSEMFYNATSFNQSLSGWDIQNAANMDGMLVNTTAMSRTNYDNTYTAWANLTSPPTDVYIGDAKYCSSEGNINTLIDTYNWSFNLLVKSCAGAPTITSTIPSDGATEVSPNIGSLTVNMSENVLFASGAEGTAYTLRLMEGANLIKSFSSTADVTKHGASFTLDNVPVLSGSTTYHVQIANAIRDWDSEYLTSFTDANTWNFTTAAVDDVRPTITSLDPAHLDTGVPVDIGTLTMTLSENVKISDDPGVETTNYYLEIRKGTTIIKSFDVLTEDVNFSGNTIELRNVPTLDYSSTYYVRYYGFNKRPIVDLSDNELLSFTNSNTWRFDTEDADTDPPVLSTTSPSNLSSDVAVDLGSLTLSFDENVNLNLEANAFIQLYTYADNSQVASFALSSANVSVQNGNEVVVTGLPTLSSNTQYWIRTYSEDGVMFTDDSGNEFAHWNFDKTIWNFNSETVADTDAPILQSVSPAINATGVAIDTDFVFTFDEDIQQVDNGGYITIASGGGVLENVYFEDAQISIDGNTLTVDPKKLMLIETNYRISIGEGLITDLAGNAFSYQQNPADEFTTSSEFDFGTSKVPADDATDVSTSIGGFSVTFDTDIQKAGNDAYMILLKRVSDNSVVKSWAMSSEEVVVNGATVTFTNVPELEANTSYWIHKEYKESFTDLDGNEIWHPTYRNTDWNFTVAAPADNTAPAIQSLAPVDNATEVAVDAMIVLTFSEDIMAIGSGDDIVLANYDTEELVESFDPMDAGNGKITISGNTITLNPTNDLDYETHYLVSIGGNVLKDVSAQNNPFAGIAISPEFKDEYDFTTVSELPEVYVTALSPAPFTEDVALDSDLVITFNEPVFFESSGNGYVRNGQWAFGFPINDTKYIELSGNEMTIHLAEIPLASLTDYYVQFQSNKIKDADGNYYENQTIILDGQAYWFTTGEAPVPEIIGFYPDQGETGIAVDDSYYFEFDIPVNTSASANLVIKNYETDEEVETVSIANLSDVYDIDFLPSSDLPYETKLYIIAEPAGAITASVGGETYVGLDDKDDWAFTTEVAPHIPVVELLSPVDNATGVAVDTDLSITFDVDVFVSGEVTLDIMDYDTETLVESIVLPEGYNADGSFTVNPTSDLSEGKHYYVLLEGTGYIGNYTGGAAYSGLSSKDDWDFTTVEALDTTAPVLLSLSPVDDATNVPLDAVFVATFDEDIKMLENEQIAVLFKGANPEIILNDDDARLSIDGATLTIDLAEDLEPDTDYSIWIKSTVSDLNDNYYTSHDQFTTWNFTTVDIMTVVAVEPGLNATDVALDADLVATFNHDIVVKNSEGRVWVRDTKGYAMWGAISDTEKFTVSGNTLTMHLAAGNAKPNNQYYFNVEENTIANANDTYYTDGIIQVNKEVWRFTTGKATQKISITTIEDKNITDADFNVSASVNSSLDLTYEVFGPATISGTTITLTGETGTVTVTVSQAGNEDYHSASESISFNVVDPGKTDQTITFEAIADKTFGDDSFALTASATSTLDVTFSVVSGPVTIDGSMVTITGAGDVTIAANQAGDESFNPASQVIRSFNIAKADQMITFEALSERTFGDAAFDLTASASSGLDVSFSIISGPVSLDGNTLSILGAGEVVIAADQSGNEDFNSAAQINQSFTVSKAMQSITASSISDKLISDDPFMVSATVDSGLPLTYQASGPATVSAEGSVTLNGETGTVTIEVIQEGNENYLSASEELSFEVTDPAKQTQTITFDQIEDKVFGDPVFTASVEASSGLEVELVVVSGPISIDGHEISILGAGEAVISANQNGDDTFNSADEVTMSFSIAKALQTITIADIEDQLKTNDPIAVVASVDSGLELTFEISGPATLEDQLITLDGTEGTVEVTVSQSGNDNYEAASEVISFEVTSITEVARSFELKAYPNPSQGLVYIQSNAVIDAIQVFDLNGGLRFDQNNLDKNVQLDLRYLPKGIYMIMINRKGQRVAQKLLIQ